MAVKAKSLESVRLLLKNNANLNLHQNTDHSPLFMSIRMGSLELFKELYENTESTVTLDDLRTQQGFTVLTYAAYCKQPLIVSYLSFRVKNLNQVDPLGHTPLSRCLINSYIEAAFKLISRGADINF
jgi:ankyrin repeat protein